MSYINFEDNEPKRAAAVNSAMEILLAIGKDDKLEAKDRIAALRTIQQMSDSFLKTQIVTSFTDDLAQDAKKTGRKISSQLDELLGKEG